MDEEIYGLPLFRGCDREVVKGILERASGRFASYRKGDFIAMQNSACRSLLILCEGSVYARMTGSDGREFTLDTLSAPDVLASAFIFSTEGIYPVTIIANTDCRLWIVGRDSVMDLIEHDAAVLHNFLTILSDHTIFLSNKLNQFALQSLTSRLMNYLENNGAVHNLQETAFVLGVTRPSLSRAISQLVRQGVVRRSGHGYVLA